jgi:DNA-binding transcriptional LysR family regulator
MINLNFYLLEEFTVLARRLNFSSAAKELCMSQSNLSKHMKELQAKTGLKLITSGYHISLTPAGKIFLLDATKILHDFEHSVQHCKEIQNQKISTLHLHESEVWTTPAQTLYSISQSFKRLHPQTPIEYIVTGLRSPIEALRDKRLDCAIVLHREANQEVLQAYENQGLLVCHLSSEPLIVWVDEDNPLLKLEHLTVSSLEQVPIITSSGRRYDPMRSVITEVCEAAGFTPTFEDFNINSITEFFLIEASAGSVFIITPQTLKDRRVAGRQNMQWRALEDSTVSAYLIAYKDTPNPVVRDFMAYAEQLRQEKDASGCVQTPGSSLRA